MSNCCPTEKFGFILKQMVSSRPIFMKLDILRHFWLEYGIQWFLHNLGLLIPNMLYTKIYFGFLTLKIAKNKMAARLRKVLPNFEYH